MVSLSYCEVLKDSKDPYHFRVKLVEHAVRHGIKAAAVYYGCSRNTVRKWLRRWRAEGPKGLRNRSRRPKHSPNRTPKEMEDKVMELRTQLKKISGKRLRMEFGIPLHPSTIYRIYTDHKDPKKPWQKHKKKQDLREEKKKLKVFEKIQIDIKDLSDIPHYLHGYRRTRLPRYQFTARDVKSGAMFVAYAKHKGLENASTHARIEEELYDVEDIDHSYDLLCKSYSYVIYFNLIRPNSHKDYKSPLKIVAEEFGVVDPRLLTLPPIILDDNFHIYLNTINGPRSRRRGHHVPGLPNPEYLII